MKIKTSYRVSEMDKEIMGLNSTNLDIVIDTDTIDDVKDLPKRIVDEVLRVYSIGIVDFNPKAVSEYEKIKNKVISIMYERKWNDTMNDIAAYERMRDALLKQMNEYISAAWKKADELKKLWLESE